MKEKIIKWLLKKLILLWDKDNDMLVFSFEKDERTGYSVHARRYYDTYYTIGTSEFPYPKHEPKEGEEKT